MNPCLPPVDSSTRMPLLSAVSSTFRTLVIRSTEDQSKLDSDVLYCAAYDVLLITSNVVVIPVFTSEIFGVNLKAGDLEEDVKPFENVILTGLIHRLEVLRHDRLIH